MTPRWLWLKFKAAPQITMVSINRFQSPKFAGHSCVCVFYVVYVIALLRLSLKDVCLISRSLTLSHAHVCTMSWCPGSGIGSVKMWQLRISFCHICVGDNGAQPGCDKNCVLCYLVTCKDGIMSINCYCIFYLDAGIHWPFYQRSRPFNSFNLIWHLWDNKTKCIFTFSFFFLMHFRKDEINALDIWSTVGSWSVLCCWLNAYLVYTDQSQCWSLCINTALTSLWHTQYLENILLLS